MAVVELAGVSKSYREGDRVRPVLRDLDARVAAGSQVALTGASGSGKSTLLALLGGMDRADAGTVRVAGVDLGALGEAARTRFRRRRLGLVFQHGNLVPTLSVRENLLLRASLDGAPRRDAAAADRLLAAVGLTERAGSRPDRLSGGEQQRVAIAAALVHRPELILADEPTGNLDRRNAERVLALFTELVREAGATLLIATHDPAVAAAAEHRWHLRDGRIVVS